MLIELRSHIVADVPIGGRMYPETLPQLPTLPAITYQVVSEWRRPSMTTVDTLPQVRVQIDCWGKSWIETHSVADAVRESIDGFRGFMGSPGVEVRGIFASSSFSGYESDTKMYRVSRDYLIWARE